MYVCSLSFYRPLANVLFKPLGNGVIGVYHAIMVHTCLIKWPLFLQFSGFRGGNNLANSWHLSGLAGATPPSPPARVPMNQGWGVTPPSPSSSSSRGMAGQSWALKPLDKRKYTAEFKSLDVSNTGFISGMHIRVSCRIFTETKFCMTTPTNTKAVWLHRLFQGSLSLEASQPLQVNFRPLRDETEKVLRWENLSWRGKIQGRPYPCMKPFSVYHVQGFGSRVHINL